MARKMKTHLSILIIGVISISGSVSQIVETCDLPEKHSTCTLSCKTKDYNLQPVTFSHPPNNDVGSCIPPHQCGSNYARYSLSQIKIGNNNITRFHIQNLNRDEDEGKWICSYGNRPSEEKYLTVHTRPQNVDVVVNETPLTDQHIQVNCSCYCVYPAESIVVELKIANDDKEVTRRLGRLQSMDVTGHNCGTRERTTIGSFDIAKGKWPGNFIDISCICTEEKLSHKQTENKRYWFQGVPKKPQNVKLDGITPNSAIVTWRKSANGGSKQTFVIQYKEASSDERYNIFRQEEENTDSYKIQLEELLPETTYDMLIYAYNKNGNGSLIGPFYFTTMAIKNEPGLKLILPFVIGGAIVLILVLFIVTLLVQRRRKRRDRSGLEETEVPFVGTWGTRALSKSSKMNIENTKALIKRITSRPFIETKSYKKGKTLLQRRNILIYKGVYGDGRFTNAMHILKDFAKDGYKPAIIHDVRQWDEIVNLNVKMILFIPDILTKSAIDRKLHESVYPYWEKMMSCIQHGKTKLIMTCQLEVMKDIWFIIGKFDIFSSSYHIDLTKEEKLSEEEKINILEKHCEINKIAICDKTENYEDANLIDDSLTINKETIRDIARTDVAFSDVATGFPLRCELFCKERKYTALGKNFFLRPSKYLVDNIDNLNVSDDENKMAKYKLLTQLWFEYDTDSDQEPTKYKEWMNDLLDTYIDKNEEGVCVLKYETIYIAVGLSIAKVKPKEVIRHANWNFFRYHMKSITSKPTDDDCDEAIFYISEDLREAVTDKCLSDLTPDTLYRYFRYVIECWPDFVEKILDAIQNQEKYAQNKNEYLDIIQNSCMIADEKSIFVQACMHGKVSAIKELRNRFNIPDEVLTHCKTISKNKPEVFDLLNIETLH